MNMLMDEAYVNGVRMYSISDWVVKKYKKCVVKTQKLLEKLLSVIYKNNIVRNVLSAAESVFIYICYNTNDFLRHVICVLHIGNFNFADTL